MGSMPTTLAIILMAMVLSAGSTAVAQPAFDLQELATYRLTAPVLKQFARATRLLADATRHDPGFAAQPLFNREIAVSGDAPVMAAALEARLRKEPLLANALHTAGMTAREYTKFALSLVAAHLAHGFVKSGVLAAVPAGVARDNVTFIDQHAEAIADVLKALEAMAEPRGNSGVGNGRGGSPLAEGRLRCSVEAKRDRTS